MAVLGNIFAVLLVSLVESEGWVQQECDGAMKGFPGLQRMQYGYNIVTDKYTSNVVVDLNSTHLFNGTKYDTETGTCLTVPDAFAKWGIYSSTFALWGFITLKTFDPNGLRYKLLEERETDLNLDHSIFGELGKKFLFARSPQIMRLMSELKDFQGQKYIEMSHTELVYQFVMSTLVSTSELLAEWKVLQEFDKGGNEPETADAFRTYFEEWGTHFTHMARSGGQILMIFIPKSGISQERTDCIRDKLDKILWKETREVNADTDCTGETLPIYDLIEKVISFCDGGDTTKCPNVTSDFVGPNKLLEWKESLNAFPAPVAGSKKWIPEMLEKILFWSDKNIPGNSDLYRSIIAEFGGSNNAREDAKTFGEFKDLLSKQLVKYLEANEYGRSVKI